MNLARRDIDSILDSIDAEIAGAPEGGEHSAYFLASQIFYDLSLADEDITHVAQQLHGLAMKYGLQIEALRR